MLTVTDMDEKLRLDSLTAFYFGAHVAAEPTSPAAITSISKRAYRDLSRTLHGISTHLNKGTLLDDTHASLREFVTDLETHPLPEQDAEATQQDFDDRHDRWCLGREKFFQAHPHSHKGKEFVFTYGQAQKWLNMALKYLAVLDHPAVTCVYPYLHVPIDSIVYEEAAHSTTGLSVPRPSGGASWSRLNREQYRAYQGHLRACIADQTDHRAPLDWEATVWNVRSGEPGD